jgi:hypothetical protein
MKPLNMHVFYHPLKFSIVGSSIILITPFLTNNSRSKMWKTKFYTKKKLYELKHITIISILYSAQKEKKDSEPSGSKHYAKLICTSFLDTCYLHQKISLLKTSTLSRVEIIYDLSLQQNLVVYCGVQTSFSFRYLYCYPNLLSSL